MDAYGKGSSYSVVDIRADYSYVNKVIVHELGHVIDSRYQFLTGKGRISETKEFGEYIQSVTKYMREDIQNHYINRNEFFAAMVVNYLVHVKNITNYNIYDGFKTNPPKGDLVKFGNYLNGWLNEMGMTGNILNDTGSAVK